MKQSHIKTVVRVRPVAHDAAAGEEQLSLTVLDNSTVQTTAPPEARAPVPRKQYQFAKVLDAVTTQVCVQHREQIARASAVIVNVLTLSHTYLVPSYFGRTINRVSPVLHC